MHTPKMYPCCSYFLITQYLDIRCLRKKLVKMNENVFDKKTLTFFSIKNEINILV